MFFFFMSGDIEGFFFYTTPLFSFLFKKSGVGGDG